MEGRTQSLEFAVPPALQTPWDWPEGVVPLCPGAQTPRLPIAYQFYLAPVRLFWLARR
jgi:hypothetical protein